MPHTYPDPIHRHSTRHHVFLTEERPPEKWASWMCACGEKNVLKGALVPVSEVTDKDLHEWREEDPVNQRCVDTALEHLGVERHPLDVDGVTWGVLQDLIRAGMDSPFALRRAEVEELAHPPTIDFERAEQIKEAVGAYDEYELEWELLEELGLIEREAPDP